MAEQNGAGATDAPDVPVRRLLRVHEVAERLDLPIPTIYGLARSGVLPSIKVGRAVRFDASDLEAFLAANKRGVPA